MRKIYALRLTMQLTPKNKLRVFWDEQPQCSGAAWPEQRRLHENQDGWIYGGSQNNGFFGGGPNSPETGDYASTHQKVQQVEYTAPTTNKLLLEAGFGTYISQWGYSERPGNPTKDIVRAQEQQAQIFDRNGDRVGVLRRLSDRWRQPEVPLIELANGLHLRAHLERGGELRDRRAQHEVRVSGRIPPRRRQPVPDDQQQLPDAVRVQHALWGAAAVSRQSESNRRHVTVRRVHTKGADRVLRVLRPGAVDEGSAHAAGRASLRPRVEQLSRAADRAVGDDPDRDRPAPADGHQGLQRLSPRIGVAYDLFGNGKTSLKGNVGRYLHPASNQGRYINANPSELVSTIPPGHGGTIDGDFSDCDVLNGAAQGNRDRRRRVFEG